MKKFMLSLVAVVTLSTASVTAAEPPQIIQPTQPDTEISHELPELQTVTIPQDPQVVVISYENALTMALRDMLPIRGADAIIRQVQNQRDDLRDHITRLERNQTTQEMRDIIDDLHDELWSLEMYIMDATIFQNRMQEGADIALQSFIYALSNHNYVDGDMLEAAIGAMVAAQTIGGTIATMEDGRTFLWAEINNIHSHNRPYQHVIDGNHRNLSEMDRQMQGMRLQQEFELIMQEHTLRVAIITVEELIMAVEIMENGIALAEEGLNQLRVMHSLGRVGIHELHTAEQELSQSRMEQLELILYRNSAQQFLNHLLGQPLSQNTIVSFQRELPEFPENRSRHVTRVVAETQAIQQIELNVLSARYALRSFNDMREGEIRRNQNANRRGETDRTRIDNDRTRDALRESYNMAVESRDQAIRAMEAAMLHGYNELERLINRLEIQNIALAAAQTHLTITQANLDLGRGTAHEIEQARFNVFLAAQAIETTLNQKWLLAFTLENPSLMF